METIGVKVDKIDTHVNAIKDENKETENATHDLKNEFTMILLQIKNRSVEDKESGSSKGE